jgi:hypothetical protein
MFSIESGDFLNNHVSFGFNTAKEFLLILHVFDFHRPSGRQTNPIFCCIIFLEIKDSEKNSMWNTTRWERAGT